MDKDTQLSVINGGNHDDPEAAAQSLVSRYEDEIPKEYKIGKYLSKQYVVENCIHHFELKS